MSDLSSSPAVTRPRFVEGQFLFHGDLANEQGYREALRRLHHLSGHGPGVVDGLELAVDHGLLSVSPGLAVDAAGRVVVAMTRIEVSLSGLGDAGSFEVWLRVTKTGDQSSSHHGVTSEGMASICLVDGAATDDPASRPKRHDRGSVDRWLTDGEGSSVFLGKVAWTAEDLTVSEAGRQMTRLVGESVSSPSGRGSMTIGTKPEDTSRFAIATEVAEDAPERAEDGPALSDGLVQPELRTRLSVSPTGDVELPEGAVVAGDLIITPTGELTRDDHTGLALRAIAPPEEARPWAIYRTNVERDGRQVQQLRIELQHPGDDVDPSRCRAVVGVAGETDFTPCLSVDARGQVTAHNSLQVNGLLAEGPVGPDPTDPFFAGAAIDSFVHGVSGAAEQADAFFAARLTSSIRSDSTPTESSEFPYQVTIRNVGSAAVEHGQVHIVVGLDDEVLVRRQELNDVTFGVEEPCSLDLDVDIPGSSAGKTLTINVLAVGVGPAGHVVSQSGGYEEEVRSPIQ